MKKKSTSKKNAKKVTKAAPKKGPGIIDSIIEYLKAGPITKEAMVTKLAKRFPDRTPEGMEVTVSTQVSRLKTKGGFNVVKSEEGYAIQ